MRILGLGTALPPHSVSQPHAAAMSGAMLNRGAREQRLVEVLFRRAGVVRRHSIVMPADDDGVPEMYWPRRGEEDSGPTTAERMLRYEAAAGDLAASAAGTALGEAGLPAAAVTHVITVSCTGFHAPGLDVELVHRVGLPPSVGRAHVGFMGCHGLFNALRLASSISSADANAHVLVASVELCSLHYSYEWDAEKLVANALFADGAGALVCTGPAAAPRGRTLEIVAFASVLLPESRDAMTWRIGNHGFEMTLAPTVPDLIHRHVPSWLNGWLSTMGTSMGELSSLAIHPGGPRILDAFAEAMNLDNRRLGVSRRVLADHGNMSSATLAFLLDQVRREDEDGLGLAVGFGPGLIAEALLYRMESGTTSGNAGPRGDG